MKKIFPLILFASLLSFQPVSYAEDEYKKADSVRDNLEEVALEEGIQVPPGMELRKIGGINMVVPNGLKVYKDGPVFRMEEDGGYSARRFKETDERFNKLEEAQKKLEEDIAQLRKAIESIRK